MSCKKKNNNLLIKAVVLSACLFVFVSIVNAQQIVINEFMASNASTIADEDGDYDDWVELFNAGATAVNLKGFGLSDDLFEPFKWTFPEITIDAGAYLIVWASGKNRKSTAQPLHTNWSIDASGEYLILSDTNGVFLSFIHPVTLLPDVSYGRYPNGSNNFLFYETATPAGANTVHGFNELLNPVTFSHHGGFFSDSISLTLSHTNTDVIIYYTLDGSEPDSANINGKTYQYQTQYLYLSTDVLNPLSVNSYQTHVYNTPLSINNRSHEADKLTGISTSFWDAPHFPPYSPLNPVFKGTVVRAKAYKQGAIPSAVTTHTFFIDSAGRNRYDDIKVISLSINEDLLFDYNKGTYVPGFVYEDIMLWDPSLQPNGGIDANYHRRGRDWEYPMNIEIFEKNTNHAVLNQIAGSRINGDWTRARPRKSFRLYARGSYGKSAFDYPVFQNQSFDSYKVLVLRNGGNNEHLLHFRDVAIQTILSSMRFETQAFSPAISFINGEFWGFLNIRERYDKYYYKRVYGIEENEIDFLEQMFTVKMGDSIHFLQTFNYLTYNSMADDYHYNHIKTRIDTDNFIDYNIANIFIRNTDWLPKNMEFWRKKTTTYQPNAPYGHDGRWRWLVYDTDHGFGLANVPVGYAYTHNTLDFATDSSNEATLPLRSLLNNESFKKEFINRYADMLNTIFRPAFTLAVIDSIKSIYDPFQQEHINRWRNRPANLTVWENEAYVMRFFAQQRPQVQRNHLRNKFQLGNDFLFYIDVSDTAHGYVKVNTIDILPSTAGIDACAYPWQGVYFKDLPLHLAAIPKTGYVFSHWAGVAETENIFSLAFTDDSVNIKAFFVTDTITHPDSTFIHYWHFNNASSIGNIIEADTSKTGMAYLHYTGNGDGFTDIVNDGSIMNTILNSESGSALRVRNPSNQRTLELVVPTTAYKNIVFKYAAKRTVNGASVHAVQYNIGTGWNTIEPHINIYENFTLQVIDFSDLEGASNNPAFKIRIVFIGDNTEISSGNNRFDNISVSGIPMPCTPVLAHYFHFNALDTNELSLVQADYSITGQAYLSYQGSGQGYMDMVDDGTKINRNNGIEAGKAIRVRNPSDTRYLLLDLPTEGLYDVAFSYAVRRTNNGAHKHFIAFRENMNANWIPFGDTISVGEEYMLHYFDFSDIDAAQNNPDFQIRLVFFGENAGAMSGNNRFDNIALHGKMLTVDTINDVLCSGGVYQFYEQLLSSSGMYKQVVKDYLSCDSALIVLNLDVKSNTSVVYETVCDTFYLPNGKIVTQSGFHKITYQNVYACDSIVFFDIAVKNIDTDIYFDGHALIAINNAADAYHWFDCTDSVFIPNEENYFFFVDSPGVYAVLIRKDSCYAFSECFDISDVLIKNNEKQVNLNVFPNPTRGQLYIEVHSADNIWEMDIYIVNLLGQSLYRESINVNMKSVTHVLDLKSLSSGMCFLLLRVNDSFYTKKLIIDTEK